MVTLVNGGEPPLWERTNDEILEELVRRLGRDSGRTATTYRSRIHAQLRRQERASGPVRLVDVVTDVALQAEVLAQDAPLRGTEQVTRRYLNGVRNAFNALITALPPPAGFTRTQLREVLAAARVAGSDQRGLRYVQRAGRRSPVDTRPVPKPKAIEELVRVLTRLGGDAAVVGEMVRFAYETGSRLGAVADVDASNLITLSSDTLMVSLHAKSHEERRLVVVRGISAERRALWRTLSGTAPLWPGVQGRAITSRRAAKLINRAWAVSDAERFTFHRLRHAYATDAVAAVGVERARRAGGWKGLGVANGYMHSSRGRA